MRVSYSIDGTHTEFSVFGGGVEVRLDQWKVMGSNGIFKQSTLEHCCHLEKRSLSGPGLQKLKKKSKGQEITDAVMKNALVNLRRGTERRPRMQKFAYADGSVCMQPEAGTIFWATTVRDGDQKNVASRRIYVCPWL